MRRNVAVDLRMLVQAEPQPNKKGRLSDPCSNLQSLFVVEMPEELKSL
jgi:hypothetical protein